MAHENGDKQRLAKRRHVQGMLDETDPLSSLLGPGPLSLSHVSIGSNSYFPSIILKLNSDIINGAAFLYKFNVKIYNLQITYDYERSTIQYYKTIPRGAKDHDYPRAIHMKNINLKLQLNIRLRETMYEQWNIETRLYERELYKNEHGIVAEISKNSCEEVSTLNLKRRAKQQKVLRTLNTIVRKAHWIYGIPKIVLEFVKV